MTIAVDSIHVVHKTSALEPCDVGKLRLFSRFSGTEPRSSNSIPDSLHRDATCTWFPLLTKLSLQTGAIQKVLPCYSDCNVSVFMLGCNFLSSRSGRGVPEGKIKVRRGGYGRGCPPPIRQEKNQNMN